MEPEIDQPVPAGTPDRPAPAGERPPPLARMRTAFNAACLLGTTAVLVAIDPKIPPFRGD